MSDYPFLNQRYAFSVCRIEPENNIHVILEAFAGDAAFPVVIVGNWGHSDYSRELKAKYRDHVDIYLLDPVYELTPLNTMRKNCYLYLHGHSCGGTNPSLVEAMYLGLAIAAFDVNFNRATTEDKALYFSSAEQLRMLCATLKEEQRNTVSSAMKEIADRRYTWKVISEKYAKLF